MAVKLDVLINYLFDNTKLKKGITDLNKQMTAAWSPYTRQNILNMGQRGNLDEYFKRVNISSRQFNDILKNTISRIKTLNTKGFFSDYLKSLYGGELPTYELFGGKQGKKRLPKEERKLAERKNLKEKEILDLAYKLTYSQVSEMEQEKKQEKKNQEQEAKDIQQRRKLDIKRNIQHSRALEENKKRDEALRKKQWMLMLGRWGKLGVWGLVAQQAIKYISKAVSFMYNTSMQGLDWERTIRGGASGGAWFGQGLAAYGRAGIGANQYQGFKRGVQGYLGSVKLGMGNAAPLMYLGLSALGDPDKLERQLERSLRRLPKDVSLALAGQMGLDYNMWEAIYSGRIDRSKYGYSEEAMKSWAKLADSLNDLVTNLNVFFFNKLAPIAEFVADFINKVINKGSSAETFFNYVSNLNPATQLANLVRFGVLEVVIKDKDGNVVGKGNANPMIDDFMEVPQ